MPLAPALSDLYRLLAVHPEFRPPRPLGGGSHLLWLGRLAQEVRLLRFGAKFAGRLTLLGFFFEREHARKYTFYLHWRCPQTQGGWQVFLHFLNARGEICFQGDHPLGVFRPDPLGFLYLRHTVDVPPETPPGIYQIRLGAWIPQEQAHLPLLRYRGCLREAPGWCHNAVLLGCLELK